MIRRKEFLLLFLFFCKVFLKKGEKKMSTRKKSSDKRLRKDIKTNRQSVMIAYDCNTRDHYRPYAIIEEEVLSLPAMSCKK